MGLTQWIAAPFKFTPIPVSVVVVLVYAIIFASVSVTDETPSVARNLGGLNLDKAYEDLHIVSLVVCFFSPSHTKYHSLLYRLPKGHGR